MKVITLLQPFATLAVIGAKTVETRSWNTNHRGELLIHSSKIMPRELRDLTHSAPFWSVLKHLENLPLGMIIGKVTVSQTFPVESVELGLKDGERSYGNWFGAGDKRNSVFISKQELAFGEYSHGRSAWLLTKAEVFKTPIPVPGNRGLWDFAMCRQCGCWEYDACIHPEYGNCSWAEKDLCTHCKNYPGEAERYSVKRDKQVEAAEAVNELEYQ